jgi:hypothetical protein
MFVSELSRNSIRRLSWLFKNSKAVNPVAGKVNLLVVKDPVYAILARTCVESFLHYHPNSQIQIYFDNSTKHKLLWHFLLLRICRRGSINFTQLASDVPWQKSKIQIIFSMTGTNDLFMDCDLRWNAAMPTPTEGSLLYFVGEKNLESYPGVIESIPIKLRIFKTSLMKNTSIFSWSKVNISPFSKNELGELWHEINIFCRASAKSELHFADRISEQVVLSLVPDIYRIPFKFLKQTDRQFDGSLCESSYYGASRGRFAHWGNTNRKSLFKGLQ